MIIVTINTTRLHANYLMLIVKSGLPHFCQDEILYFFSTENN